MAADIFETRTQARTPANSGQALPAALKRFLQVLVALTLLCVAVELWCGIILHRAYPYTWPLMPRDYPFLDFALYESRFAYFNSPAFFTFEGPIFVYPAPLAVVYRVFFYLPYATDFFLGSLSAAFFAAALLFARKLVSIGLKPSSAALFLGAVCFCSYPFFFEFEQANLEWIVATLIGTGIWFTLRRWGYAAAVCFGMAASMKIYPIIFVGLFLSRRQYRQAAAALLVCGLNTLVSLWLLCPDLSLSWRGTQHGVSLFRQWYILRYEQVGFDHSLIALAKAFLLSRSSAPPGPTMLSLFVNLYLPVAAFAGIILYFDRIRRLPIVNQVICLSVACLLLPPVSYEYTLLNLYAPWGLLVLLAVESRERIVPGLSAALVCFAILFAPETELIFHQRSYGGQVKSLTLIALMLVALRHRFPSAYDFDGNTKAEMQT